MTATATKDKKETKKKPGHAGKDDLPLKGNLAQGEQKTIDGEGFVKSPPDPLVFERAKLHADDLDKVADAQKAAQRSAGELISAFAKSHKARYVRIPGKHATYVFTMKTLTKLVKEKQDKVN